MWVKQCHKPSNHHPPVIKPSNHHDLLGGMFTISKWLVYNIVLPTL